MTLQDIPNDPRFAAADWYLAQGFLGFTLWGTDEHGACRCPKGSACDQKPGKHPIGGHGFKDATDDPSNLRTRLSAGSRPNLGVLVPEGCFGWDLDGDDAERIRQLEATIGALPPTMGHETPNGRHAIYRWPEATPRPDGQILGVVTRWRDNGYLVGASSRIGDKVYRLRRGEHGEPLGITEFPSAWVRAALEYRPAKRPTVDQVASRHPDLVSTARHLAGRGLRGEALYQALSAINAEYPGGPKSETELRRIVRWADDKFEPDPDTTTTDVAGRRDDDDETALAGDSFAAAEFARLAGAGVRFDHGSNAWFVWSGHRWRRDDNGAIVRRWHEVIRRRLADAASDPGLSAKELGRVTAAIVGATSSISRIRSGLAIAASMLPIATSGKEWDVDPWLLGCENGVVDLHTGDLRPGRPEDAVTLSTGLAYDPAAECPTWERFLADIFGGDQELVDWVQLALGYSLIGRVILEILLVLIGGGHNGKSTFLEADQRVLGEYAAVIPSSTILERQQDNRPDEDIVKLRGRRLAVAFETSKSLELDDKTLKRVTSRDKLYGRAIYEHRVEWFPTHTAWLATNNLPKVSDASIATWRRLVIIPFRQQFATDGQPDLPPADLTMPDKLAAEAPGILAWLVRGSVRFVERGTLEPFPAAVRSATRDYRLQEDRLGEFVEECASRAPGIPTSYADAFSIYQAWSGRDERPADERLEQRAFSRQLPASLATIGIVTTPWRAGKVRGVRGVRFAISDADDASDALSTKSLTKDESEEVSPNSVTSVTSVTRTLTDVGFGADVTTTPEPTAITAATFAAWSCERHPGLPPSLGFDGKPFCGRCAPVAA